MVRLAVKIAVRHPLSLLSVEDLLHERGIGIAHETAGFWVVNRGRFKLPQNAVFSALCVNGVFS
jgi:putative transposase